MIWGCFDVILGIQLASEMVIKPQTPSNMTQTQQVEGDLKVGSELFEHITLILRFANEEEIKLENVFGDLYV